MQPAVPAGGRWSVADATVICSRKAYFNIILQRTFLLHLGIHKEHQSSVCTCTLTPTPPTTVPPYLSSPAAHNQVSRRYHVLFPKAPEEDGDGDGDEGTGFRKNLTTGAARHPVIIAFHGNGGDAASLAMQTPHLSTLGPREGYFLIYAEGVQTPGSRLRCQERSWNSGTCCGAVRTE